MISFTVVLVRTVINGAVQYLVQTVYLQYWMEHSSPMVGETDGDSIKSSLTVKNKDPSSFHFAAVLALGCHFVCVSAISCHFADIQFAAHLRDLPADWPILGYGCGRCSVDSIFRRQTIYFKRYFPCVHHLQFFHIIVLYCSQRSNLRPTFGVCPRIDL